MQKSDGVRQYDCYTVRIYFPKGTASCATCPLLETYSRLQCRRSGEYLLDKNGMGWECPLQKVEDSNV